MWFVILPLVGAAAGAWLGRESPAIVWTMFAIMLLVIAIGLGDPALAVVVLGCVMALVLGVVILYNIIPIIIFLLGAGIALAFIIVVFAGIFRLLGV